MAEKGFNGIHRDTWIIEIKSSRVAKAAKAKVAFHKSRVTYWTKEREKAHKAVQKKGLKLEANPQFLSDSVSTAYTSNKVKTAEVDYALIEKWQQCNRKVEDHKAKVRDFSKWLAFLTTKDDKDNEDNLLNLSFQDMDFFGLVGGETVGNE